VTDTFWPFTITDFADFGCVDDISTIATITVKDLKIIRRGIRSKTMDVIRTTRK
jgi:hypothetical protein